MRSMGMLQLVGGIAVAGVVTAGTTALTGSGLDWAGSGTGQSSQFVGGKLIQTVNGGAQVTDITYGFLDSPANNQLNSISVTLNSDAANDYLYLKPTGGALSTATKWTCTGGAAAATYGVAAAGTIKVHLDGTPAQVVCITADANGAAGYYNPLATLEVSVNNT